MDKGSSAKFLIVLVLISGTLSGCLSGESSKSQGSTSPNTQSSTTNGSVPSPISSEVKQKFKELKNAYDNYQRSQDQLVFDLPADQIDKKNPPQIDTKDAGDKLEKFAQASQSFRQALQSLDKQDRKYKILEQVEQTKNELSSKILKPLEKGLQEQAIEEVQKNLNFFQQENFDINLYGTWGNKTKKYTTEFLQNNAKKLANNIQELENLINSDGTSTNTNSTTSSTRSSKATPLPQKSTVSPEQVKDLTYQVKDLTGQVKDLTGQVNNFKLVSFILLVGAILAFVLSISIKNLKKTNTNSSGQGQALPNNRDSSPQMNQEDYNQLYRDISNHINTQLYPHFTNINNRIEQLEQRQTGSQVNDYQEGKSFLGKQEEVKKDAIKTQSSILSARGSVYKQNYSQSSKLVVNYNQNTKDFLKSATVVSETDESINNRRLGSGQPVVLEESKKGNYCIIKDAGVNYMVPKENFKINQYNYNTVEFLFECPGYQSGYSSNFRLVKPASVSPTSGNKWLLIERGILEFSSSRSDIYYGSPM